MDELKTSKIWNSKWPALILMLVGVCFMGYGISRGELAVVFTKAINIEILLILHYSKIKRQSSF